MKSLMNFVERHQVTMISGFPYLLAEMNHLPHIPACLRLLISGGDVLRGAYVDRLLEQAEVYNTYGPSETCVCASYYHCNGGTVLKDGTYPIGKPVLGAKICILDADGNILSNGETGEICIYGRGRAIIYDRLYRSVHTGNESVRSTERAFRKPRRIYDTRIYC